MQGCKAVRPGPSSPALIRQIESTRAHAQTWLIDADPRGWVRLKLLKSSSAGTSSSLDSTLDTWLAVIGGTSSWSFLAAEVRCDWEAEHRHATEMTVWQEKLLPLRGG